MVWPGDHTEDRTETEEPAGSEKGEAEIFCDSWLTLPRLVAQKKDPWVHQPAIAGLEGADQYHSRSQQALPGDTPNSTQPPTTPTQTQDVVWPARSSFYTNYSVLQRRQRGSNLTDRTFLSKWEFLFFRKGLFYFLGWTKFKLQLTFVLFHLPAEWRKGNIYKRSYPRSQTQAATTHTLFLTRCSGAQVSLKVFHQNK